MCVREKLHVREMCVCERLCVTVVCERVVYEKVVCERVAFDKVVCDKVAYGKEM